MIKLVLTCLFYFVTVSANNNIKSQNDDIYEKYIVKGNIPNAQAFKELRIKAAFEISSVGQQISKGGEVFRMMVLMTYVAHVSKESENTKIIKELWSRFVKLPFPANVGPRDGRELYSELLLESNQLKYYRFIDYFMGILQTEPIINELSPLFSYIIYDACSFYSDIRNENKLVKCWDTVMKIKGTDPMVTKLAVDRQKIRHYRHTYESRKVLRKIINEVIQNSLPGKEAHLDALYGLAYYDILDGKNDEAKKAIETIKEYEGRPGEVQILNSFLYTKNNDIQQALKTFQSIKLSDEISAVSYYTLGTEIYFIANDYQKSKELLHLVRNRLGAKPFEALQVDYLISLMDLIVDRPMDSNLRRENKRIQFKEYKNRLKEYNVTDKQYRTYVDIGLSLENLKTVQKVSLIKSFRENLKKYHRETEFSIRVLDQYINKISHTDQK